MGPHTLLQDILPYMLVDEDRGIDRCARPESTSE